VISVILEMGELGTAGGGIPMAQPSLLNLSTPVMSKANVFPNMRLNPAKGLTPVAMPRAVTHVTQV